MKGIKVEPTLPVLSEKHSIANFYSSYMKLLLIHPYFPYRGKDLFPLGLGYIASAARKYAEIRVIDEIVHPFTREEFRAFDPDFVGITATTPSFNRAEKIISIIKKEKPSAKVIFGGVHVTFKPEKALNAGADIVVRGEGEEAFVEILSDKALEDIKGISYHRNKEIINNPDRDLIEDLDSIPMPAWEFFPMKEYKIMSLVSARGCPYSCAYCSASSFWQHRVRFRSPENFMTEVRALYNMGKKRLRFMDSTFTLDRKRALEICSMIEEEGFKDFKYSIETRADHLDKELFEALRNSGCDLVCLGVDSGSQQVLDACNRKVDVEEVKMAILMAKQYGLNVRAYVTYGFPGESRENVEATVRLLRETRPQQILLSLATIYPGTELEGGKEIKVHPNWVEKFHGHGYGAELYFPETLERDRKSVV